MFSDANEEPMLSEINANEGTNNDHDLLAREAAQPGMPSNDENNNNGKRKRESETDKVSGVDDLKDATIYMPHGDRNEIAWVMG